MEYNYNNAYLRHPCADGVVAFDDGSSLKTHDIMNELPRFMKKADVLFTDPPWNATNLCTFYTKADMVRPDDGYAWFYSRLFECIGEIAPKVCYLEIGKEFLAEFIFELRKLYKYVTFYNSSYYHKADNHCYVVRGSNTPKKPRLDGMDEEEIIAWVCANEQYECIGDLCMGQGLVAQGAAKAGRTFVGTELNHKRLAVTIERVMKARPSRIYEIKSLGGIEEC